MNVTIDMVADAATFVWGERARGATKTVDVPGRGVRLMLSTAGDVVGMEVLGWSGRTEQPSEVAVRIAGVADVLGDDDPLAAALVAAAGSPQPQPGLAGRPMQDGEPMINAKEAAERIHKDRSWTTRLLNKGTLRGRKIGNEWWTTAKWIQDYQTHHSPATSGAHRTRAR